MQLLRTMTHDSIPPIFDQACERQLWKILTSRKDGNKTKSQQKIPQIIRELRSLADGTREEQAVAWYYLHFALGFGYVIRKNESLCSIPGWIDPTQLSTHLGVNSRQPFYLGVRPANKTSWVIIDIDEGSRYHPLSETGEGDIVIKNVLSTIGLHESIDFQSSTSSGIHLLYPLSEVKSTWEVANSLEQCLRAAGLEISPGILELRPNVKDWNSKYLAIRAPLTGEGNSFWAPEFSDFGLHDDLLVFKQLFSMVQQSNEFRPFKEDLKAAPRYSPNRRGPVSSKGSLKAGRERLAEGFTGPRQTNELTFLAQQQARLVEGIDTVQGLRLRCSELVQRAEGFSEFCSHQKEVEDGSYWTEKTLRRALELTPGGYVGTWREASNQRRAEDTTRRAHDTVSEALKHGLRFSSINKAIAYLKTKGGPSASWWKNPKNSDAKSKLLALVQG